MKPAVARREVRCCGRKDLLARSPSSSDYLKKHESRWSPPRLFSATSSSCASAPMDESNPNNSGKRRRKLKREKVWRPSLEDVERISQGLAAKSRGVGSRAVCHRLNQEERKVYELAKRLGYLAVKGTGYRKERKGSPLINTFRQWCDARGVCFVRLEKQGGSSSHSHDTNPTNTSSSGLSDTVIIDLSPLRIRDDSSIVDEVLALANQLIVDSSNGNSSGQEIIITGNNFQQKEEVDQEAIETQPIWAVRERELRVSCSREDAKELASELAKALGLKVAKKSGQKKERMKRRSKNQTLYELQ